AAVMREKTCTCSLPETKPPLQQSEQEGTRRRTVMHIAGGRFLVTGGASLIGSHLTQQLLEAGAAAVILFDNYALGSPEVAASLAQDRRVAPVRGDLTRHPELLAGPAQAG